jgi:hypothetical protein
MYQKIEYEKHQQLFSPQIFNHSITYCQEVKWTQSQRISFHLYMMTFGVNHFSNIQELLTKLHTEYPGVFPEISEEMRK